MKVKLERIKMGTYLPYAKKILASMSYVDQDTCDQIVDNLSLSNTPITIGLRGPFPSTDWDRFNDMFEYVQMPSGPAGSAKHFVDSLPDSWDDDEWNEGDDSDEEDPTAMQLFCIKTEAKTGHKYEILVLATTEKIALEHAIRDPAVVKSIDVWPGPFTNGTVLSTKIIH